MLPGRVVRTTTAHRANTAPGRANTALCFWDFRALHPEYDLVLSPSSGLYGQPPAPGPLARGATSTLIMAREYTFACWVYLAPTGVAPLRCVARYDLYDLYHLYHLYHLYRGMTHPRPRPRTTTPFPSHMNTPHTTLVASLHS